MADQRAEQTIVEELRHARPDWGFLLEEGGEIAGDPDKPRWIVDPLDGTTNFLHGIPHFAISIAVEERAAQRQARDHPGLVYQPLTDESFWAEKGRGAWLQRPAPARLRAARPGRSADRDRHSVQGPWRLRALEQIFDAVAPGGRRHPPLRLGRARPRLGRGGPLRRLLGEELQPWDVAAGILLVREAGGFVTDFRGGDAAMRNGQFLAANDGSIPSCTSWWRARCAEGPSYWPMPLLKRRHRGPPSSCREEAGHAACRGRCPSDP